ncbi:nucleotide-binding domain-containing protein [Meira miltonrushii]|uniref:NADPH:adrenodoxin oxidoreductase, mitochondrial n=1 Tax=Meira miltonrushii TaxID=1280837 RepID=A0A316V5Q8_9BASI|nr:nucleotide-binding domain-containing protein [Meira miltonrushii]PWN32368.1 nucleotide-binding domain-containing protein [Meira miltonrushii]
MATTSSTLRPIKVAIIGSGPSAFYSAARLLANATKDGGADVHVHMYERLPTPNGLVRYGVAPDHPEVKNVEHKFAQVAEDKRFRFFGNVNITGENSSSSSLTYPYPLATQLPITSLIPHYTHLLLSYGCSLAQTLDIPGSKPGELKNVHSALDFVNWYNGHPAAHDPAFLQQEPWRAVDFSQNLHQATVIGAGNVALDVARILLRSRSTLTSLFTADTAIKARAALRETDIPEPVLEQLSKSQIDHVEIVARRGPAQVAFTNKELREMMELQDVTFIKPKDEYMHLAHEQVKALEAKAKGTIDSGGENTQAAASEARVRKRLLSIIEKGSATKESKTSWSMDFFKGPNSLLPSSSKPTSVGGIRWDEMAFEPTPSTHDRDKPWSGGATTGQHHVRATGNQSERATDMVIASVGYKAAPLDSESNSLISWDVKKGIVPNRGGQVIDANGNARKGMYVSGWLARGPVGVIASTRIDANSVVEQMLHDWRTSNGSMRLEGEKEVDLESVPEELRQSTKRVVTWQDWLRIDAYELTKGQELGKLREKVLSVAQMLSIIE